MKEFSKFCDKFFGCSIEVFMNALIESPGSRGAVLGAISETMLKEELESQGYEVLRIKEKPSGGNDAKNKEARGDFYVRERGSKIDKWIVVESKGLKSNSEFRGGKFGTPEQVISFIRSRAFPAIGNKNHSYLKGFNTYKKIRDAWMAKNAGKRFPEFSWDRETPGPDSSNIEGLWRTEEEMASYFHQLPPKSFSEEAYRDGTGAIAVLETHKPSKREGILTGIVQAAPLVTDFGILAVDLFFRTGKHEFAFANPTTLSHSPNSPEHLYQNYTIDILIPGLKSGPRLKHPWYRSFKECASKTHPRRDIIDESQIDHRKS